MGMLLRRYYDETYTNPVEDKNKGVATSVAPKAETKQVEIAEPEKDAVDLESLNLVELRKLGKEHGIPNMAVRTTLFRVLPLLCEKHDREAPCRDFSPRQSVR